MGWGRWVPMLVSVLMLEEVVMSMEHRGIEKAGHEDQG